MTYFLIVVYLITYNRRSLCKNSCLCGECQLHDLP